jgi:hypothetical protein
MLVKDLKELLKDIPPHLTEEEFDELQVLIPTKMYFDGVFFSPCKIDSGRGEYGTEDGMVDSFLLIPCGFFTRSPEEIEPNLN